MAERFSSGGLWEQTYGYSRVVVAGPWWLVAGTTATVGGVVQHVGDAHAQTVLAFRSALEALARAGAAEQDVVRTRMYVVGAEHADAVGRAHGEVFGAVRPVSTLVVVARLIHPDHLVEVEVEAYRPAAPPSAQPDGTGAG
ncbi:MAG TPA: RidA family protein [Micromonosporaceae bacterium]|nr:RidA family protein [Micromonosporaceae bacterium]